MSSILVLNGPNLNLLGTRQPEVYGRFTLADVEGLVRDHVSGKKVDLKFYQSNSEGALIDALHDARGVHNGIIFNPGAYSHTSIALMDAALSIEIPLVEVHLSNIYARESFRHNSYITNAAIGVVCGFGVKGYVFAIDALLDKLNEGT